MVVYIPKMHKWPKLRAHTEMSSCVAAFTSKRTVPKHWKPCFTGKHAAYVFILFNCLSHLLWENTWHKYSTNCWQGERKLGQKRTQTEVNSLSQIIMYRQNSNQRGSDKHLSCTKQDHIHSELKTSFRQRTETQGTFICMQCKRGSKTHTHTHTHKYTKHIRSIPRRHIQDAPGNHQ